MAGGGRTGIEREHRTEERKLKAVYEELRRHPARYRQVLDGIYERMPRWMRPVMPRPSRGGGRRPLAALRLLVARCSRAL